MISEVKTRVTSEEPQGASLRGSSFPECNRASRRANGQHKARLDDKILLSLVTQTQDAFCGLNRAINDGQPTRSLRRLAATVEDLMHKTCKEACRDFRRKAAEGLL